MKKVIITGASGFIGKTLVRTLIENDFFVYVVTREKSNYNFAEGEKKVKLLPYSIWDKRCANELPKGEIEFAYHLGWGGGSGNCRADYKLQMDNIKYALQFVEFLDAIGCRKMIGIGSVAEEICKNYIFNDGLEPLPMYHYGIAKVTAKYMTKAECNNRGITHLWAMLPNVYGVGDSTNNFINRVMNMLQNGERASFTEGLQLDDFTYVTDIANALLLLGLHGISSESYYVGYGKSRPIREYITIMRDVFAPNTELYFGEVKDRGIYLTKNVYDCSKLKALTDFKPSVPYEEGIKKIIDEKLTSEWIKK